MIEYIDLTHTYLNDGVIIPSVSNLVEFATKDDYSVIPPIILKKAQDFGTDIHNAIENYFTKDEEPIFDDPYKRLAFEQFIKLKGDIIEPLCETLTDFNGRYAGRIDCIYQDVLVDYKTNTNINIPHLEWQLGLYKMALESKGYTINRCRCLWLPKRHKGEWVEITPKSNEECLQLLNDYEQSKTMCDLPFN